MSDSHVDVVEVALRIEADAVHFGIPANMVREVVRPPASFDKVAVTEPAILGVFELGGTTLAVVDLARVIGATAQPSVAGRLVVVEWNGRRLAFAVDQAFRLRRLPQDRVLDKYNQGSYVKGYTKVEDERELFILDVERVILDLEQKS